MNDEQVYSACVSCGEQKIDPYEFYDGLRCIVCAEQDEAEGEE